MKNIVILIVSRMVNGIIGLLLFLLLKQIIIDNSYDYFSSSYATLVLLSTFSGGILGGLLLKNVFHFGTENHRIIYFYIALFSLFMFIGVELAYICSWIQDLSRWGVYFFLITHLLSTVTLIHYQLKQQFLRMTLIDIARNLVPLILVLGIRWTLPGLLVTVNEVIVLLSIGNLFGLFFLIRCISLHSPATSNSLPAYLQLHLKKDLLFGFSFGSFNALAQLVVVGDRNILLNQTNNTMRADIAYTADQLTKINNGVLFPLNTKVSSELGIAVRDQHYDVFYKKINQYAGITLGLGMLLVLGVYSFVSLFNHFNWVAEFNKTAILYYGAGNTVYLACLIYQKRFDYTRYKFMPALLILSAAGLGYLFHHYVFTWNYFFITMLFFGLLMLLMGRILPNKALVLDR